MHDGDERDGEEEEEREVRSARKDERCDEPDQCARPQVDQEATPAILQPPAPRHEHRGCIAGGRGDRQTEHKPTLSRAEVEGKAAEHGGDCDPTEPEPELERAGAKGEIDLWIGEVTKQ